VDLVIAAFKGATFLSSAFTHETEGNGVEAFTVRQGQLFFYLRSTMPHGKILQGSAGCPAKTTDDLEQRRSISPWQRSTFGTMEARWG
jgi:hypothetical protein